MLTDAEVMIPSAAPTRQQFRSFDEVLESAFFGFDSRTFSEPQCDSVRKLLRNFGKTLLDEFSHAVERGFQRALMQTTEVFSDPEFFTVTKKQCAAARRKQSGKWKAEREKREQERLRPATAIQIMARRHHLLGMIEYSTNEAERYRKEYQALEENKEVFLAAAGNADTKGIV